MRLRHVVVASIAVIVSTLSLSEAQRVWNRDTLSFHPQRYIKETGAVFEQLKIDHTDAIAPFEIYLEGGVWQIRSGGGRIRDLPTPTGAGQATNKGYVDGIRNTLQNADNDARPNTFEFPEHSNNPNTNSVSRAYWNTTVDSLRIRTSTGWRNIGQRGAGYYELQRFGTDTNDSRVRVYTPVNNATGVYTETDRTGSGFFSTSRYHQGTITEAGARYSAYTFCAYIHSSQSTSYGLAGVASYGVLSLSQPPSDVPIYVLDVDPNMGTPEWIPKTASPGGGSYHVFSFINCIAIYGTM